MAKRIDTSNLTVDFRQLMKLTVQDRINFYQSGGQSYFESLTPTQLAQLFPKFYQRQLPDIGKAVSGGTAGTAPSAAPAPTTGGGVTSGALGRAARSQAAPGQPQGQPKPSSTAQQNSFYDHIMSIGGKPGQQQTSSQNIPDGMNPLAIDRQNASKNLSHEDKIHMYALSIAEKGDKTPKRNAELMESIYNRYMAQRKPSIQSTMMSDYYQPLRPEADPRGWARYQAAKKRLQSDADYFNKFDAAHNEVISGSNYTNYGTHNASLGVASSARRSQTITHTSGEETYSRKDIIAFAGEHGLGTVRNEKAWFESIKRRMDEYYANQANNPNVKPPSRVTDATSVQKPEQERPSQSGATTGLTPGSSVPGKGGATAATGYAHPTGQQGRVSSSFGMRVHPVSGIKKMHTGVDMAVPMGSSVQSIAEGKIIYVGKKGGYGYTVDVQHADGTISRYAHLSEFKAKVGDTVKAGQIIALSGGAKDHPGSGTSTGPHLHFEIRKDGVPVDPMPYLQQQMPAAVSKDGEKDKQQLSKPSDYDSWNPQLRKEIEGLTPSQQQAFFNKIQELRVQGFDVNAEYEQRQKDTQSAGVTPQQTATATIATVTNAPPGELPQVNPAGFGVGMIHGEQKYKPEQEKDRPGFSTGRIKFTGFDDEDLAKAEFQAGSGGREKNKPSVPSGTFNLSPQATGSVISDYYRRHGINPSQGAFGRVYNVGLPGSPTIAGYDPKIKRTRTQIQIHSNVNKDVDKLISSGCITVSPDEYPRLVENIERARKASKSGISLVVENNSDGTTSFTIMPSARATNPISVNTAAKNVQETGNIAGIPQATPEQQLTQTGTPSTQVITPSPQTTGSSALQSVTPAAPATPAPATPAPVASQVQPQSMPAPAPPTPAPAFPQVQPQSIPASAAQQPAITATPVQEAPPRQEDQVKPNAVGGQEQTTENIGFYDTNTGKTLGTAQRGEVVALNQSGIAEIKPEQRISEIPQLRSDMPQQQNAQTQYEPEQQTMPTNMAAMTSSQPNVPSAQENFYDVSESSSPSGFFISESYKRAMMAYNKFQTTDRKIDNGSNTLFT